LLEVIIALIHFAVLIIGIYKIIKFFKNRSLPSIKRRKKIEKDRIKRERIEKDRIKRERIEKDRIKRERIEKEKQKIDDAKAVAAETPAKVSANTKGGALPKGFEPEPEPKLMSMPGYLIPKTDTAYVEKREQRKIDDAKAVAAETPAKVSANTKGGALPKGFEPEPKLMSMPGYLIPKTDTAYVEKREQRKKKRIKNERIEKERIKKERIKKERIEKERIKKERIEKERIKNEREQIEIIGIPKKDKGRKDMLSKYPLYHLSSIENLKSILSEGILSHDLSKGKKPKRLADAGIVNYRKTKIISSRYSLTHYANFYFRSENAMLWRIVNEAKEKTNDNPENIIIFEINLDVLLPGIFVSDGNCARKISRIEPVTGQTHNIFSSIDDMMMMDIDSWFHDTEVKRKFQAECLIPEKVDVSFIHTIHVKNEHIEHKINSIILNNFPNLKNIKVKQNPTMFFSKYLKW
jgi:hypothetical protein